MYCNDGCGTQPLDGVSLGVLPLLVGEPKQHKGCTGYRRCASPHKTLSLSTTGVFFIWSVYYNIDTDVLLHQLTLTFYL